MKNAESVTTGEGAIEREDFEKQKLDSSNLGVCDGRVCMCVCVLFCAFMAMRLYAHYAIGDLTYTRCGSVGADVLCVLCVYVCVFLGGITGMQMLQKAGWKEGEGLGADKAGIAKPLNMEKSASDAAG